MLSARDLTLRRGREPLFEHVDFIIFRGDKVGITGANGTGKSSLFAAILGELHPDAGDIDVPAGLKIGHVEQEIAASPRAAIEFVLDGDAELRSVLGLIEDAERRDAAMALAEAHGSLQAIDGYRARARAAAIMHGLGFKASDHSRAVSEFSGGWRVRLAMARALCSRADLLLLDEPTNHLDLDAIVWLEDWLTAYPGTLLMISHDREFLDAIIDRVLHIENRSIHAYSGNYSQFEQKRTEELALQTTLHARQMRRIAQITSFVNRFRASATKSRQAQSRIKMLERMERIVPAHVDSPFEFEFLKPLKTPRPLLTVEDAVCGYGDTRIVSGINASISPQDRIALLGPNGAGKSTFTKMLAGETPPLGGRRIAAADLSIGYFAQQQMEQLRPDCDAFWHLRNLGGPDFAKGDEQRVRDMLGQFGFAGDRAFEPVGRFSGGEKARLTLAILVARRPNLLLLDEPTNHLDIDMRHALTVALQSFEGGLMVVSHDRHLIKTVADSLWLVADGKLEVFEGDLDDYQQWLRSRGKKDPDGPAAAASGDGRPGSGAVRAGAAKKAPANRAARELLKLRREIEQVEQRIAAIAAAQARVETALCRDPMDVGLQSQHAGPRRGGAGDALDGNWHGHRGCGNRGRRPGLAMAHPSSFMRYIRIIPATLLCAWVLVVFWNSAKPLPAGVHVISQVSRLSDSDVEFLRATPHDPVLAEREAAALDRAEQLIVVDRSPVTRELAQLLLARKRTRPKLKIVVTTDPANEAFGGTPAQTLASLEQAGIIVARVQLDRLRDSNPLYSGLWRLLLGWWSDPFDEAPGRPTVRGWARMLNFKADRRQLLVADDGSGGWNAIIAPGGAGAGLALKGNLARAMIASELHIAKWSADEDRLPAPAPMDGGGLGSIDARFLSEGGIEAALLDAVRAAGQGDQIGIAVGDLSHRPLIDAAMAAAWRGAQLRVLLSRDPMPNQVVADELQRDGGGRIEVRWCPGEPAAPRPSLLTVRHRNDLWVNLSSAKFTRRDLADLNLVAGVELRMPPRAAAARAVSEYFDGLWSGAAAATGVANEGAAKEAPFAYWRYRFAEATGLSSF